MSSLRLSCAACAALLLAAGCPPPPDDVDAGAVDGSITPKDGGPIARPDAGIDPRLLPCVEDALEDNDESAAASALAVGTDVQATLCAGDADWYRVEADVGCSIDARASFDPSYGDLDLHLFHPSGALLAAATTAGAQEAVQANADVAGTYLLRVSGPSTAKTAYTLRAEVVCAAALSCPADDPYEENDDDAGAPAPLTDGLQAAGIVCAGDADTYAIESAPGCVLDARLSFVDADGDLDLDVRIGERLLARSSGSVDGERVLTTAPDGVQPVFRVHGFQDAQNTYRFSIDAICPSEMACPADDPFEPNDDDTAATDLDPPDNASGIACGQNEDWYELFPTSGCTLTAELLFTHGAGDLDLKLLQNDGTQVGSSTSVDDDERIEYPVPAAGRLRLRVYGHADAENRYRLLVSEACP